MIARIILGIDSFDALGTYSAFDAESRWGEMMKYEIQFMILTSRTREGCQCRPSVNRSMPTPVASAAGDRSSQI